MRATTYTLQTGTNQDNTIDASVGSTPVCVSLRVRVRGWARLGIRYRIKLRRS